ncbi:MAG TPA: hypothetical protein VJQ47_16050 [Steroidobacteraceae bacterium]|nr:hypothetical protein [Steroidobacteraceae bacterium]
MSKAITTQLAATDSVMAAIIQAAGPYHLTPELTCEPFEALSRAIAHQQLHATAAGHILKRFIEACGHGSYPTAETVLATADAVLRAVGFSFSKIASVKDLAAKTLDGTVPKRESLVDLSDDEIIERLTKVRGIGRWTVEMMLMFQLGRPDVLPVDDFGVRAGFRFAYGLRKAPSPRALALFGQRWAPNRTAAAWYLWRAIELKKAGALPEPAERIRLPRVIRKRRKEATRRRQKSRLLPPATKLRSAKAPRAKLADRVRKVRRKRARK